MKRRNLQKLAILLAFTGLAVAVVFFSSSFVPNEKARPGRTQIDVSELQQGSFVEQALQSSHVFVLRNFDDQIHVYTVPYREGAYWLPEFDWSRPAVPCVGFGPDNNDGELIENGAFRCWLPDYGEFFRREHSWSYAGRNLGYRTADMKIANYEIEHDTIVLLE